MMKSQINCFIKLSGFIALIICLSYIYYLDGSYSNLRNKREDNCVNTHLRNVLLVITFNTAHYNHISLLLDAYGKVFNNIVLCGPIGSSSTYPILKYISQRGFFSYDECVGNAMRDHNNYTGYLTMSDDVLLNIWNLNGSDLMKIWQGPEMPYKLENKNVSSGDDWLGWESEVGLTACKKAFQKISLLDKYQYHLKRLRHTNNTYGHGLIMRNVSNYHCYAERSDIFYVPQHLADEFIELSSILKSENVFLEIAVPTLIRLLAEDVINLKGIYMSGNPLRKSEILLQYFKPTLDFIHPLKFDYGDDSAAGLNFFKTNFSMLVNSLLSCNNSMKV